MGLLFNGVYTDIFVFLTGIWLIILIYYQWSFKYWERKNVPYLEPKFPFGTMGNPFFELEAIGDRIKRQYQKSKKLGHKHVGLFNFFMPVYMPIDLEYIKNILITDFDHFVDRGVCYDKDDPRVANLFFIEGTKWQVLRTKLANVFSSDNTRTVFQTLLRCGDQLKKGMDDISSKRETVDIKDILDRHTIDVIFSCVFGIDSNSFRNPNSDIIKGINRVFTSTKVELLRNFLFPISPKLARLLGFQFVPKEPSDFFAGLVKDTVTYRETTETVRHDFMQVLIDIRNKATEKYSKVNQPPGENLTMDEVIAQEFLFFIAGYETLTAAVAFCLVELTLNLDIQEKLRAEINSVFIKHNGTCNYEAIMEMVYMDQILKETMRKYPPVPILNRKCVQNYKIPGTNTIIRRGTDVIIPIIGLHHDAEYYFDPEKFDPERFNSKSKGEIDPLKYMPFGGGPRICCGIQFAVVQMKLALTVLLKNYTFSLNRKTDIPLKMNPFRVALTSVGDIWLDITKLEI